MVVKRSQCCKLVINIIFFNIEKASTTQIHSHLINNDIVDNFQSAYKTGHSCETALLRVYNDIVTTIGRGECAMLVLLNLSTSFDTIDHDNLFCILKQYVGICGNVFIEKILKIKMEFPLLEACLPAYSFIDIDTTMPVCSAVFDIFQPLSCDVLASIIHKLNRTTCG